MNLSELTDKIYAEGVEKGNAEAQQIVANANAKAEEIIAKANAKANSLLLLRYYKPFHMPKGNLVYLLGLISFPFMNEMIDSTLNNNPKRDFNTENQSIIQTSQYTSNSNRNINGRETQEHD